MGIKNGCLTAENVSGVESEFVIYTAMPAERTEGEIIFSAEETDFGEVCAYVKRGCKLVPAPQLRCPAEITYVFRNEPKVKMCIRDRTETPQTDTDDPEDSGETSAEQ